MASPDEIEALYYEALQAADLERLIGLWGARRVRALHPPRRHAAGGYHRHQGQLRKPVRARTGGRATGEVKRLVTDALVIHQVHERVLVPGSGGRPDRLGAGHQRLPEDRTGLAHGAAPRQPGGQAIESPDLHTGSGSVLH
jgi:hypothetical protein